MNANPQPRYRPDRVPPPWAIRYDLVASIADELGRLPRRSDDIDAAAVAWVADQRRSTALNEEQRRALALLPGWDEATRDGAWYERADELRAFVTDEQRPPRFRSAEESERGLAHWLWRQRRAAAHGELSAERSAALTYALRGLVDQERRDE